MKTFIEYIQKKHITDTNVVDVINNIKIYSNGPATKEIVTLFDLNSRDEAEACTNADKLWDRLTEQAWNIYQINCIQRYKKENKGSILAEGEYWFLADNVDKFNDDSLDFNMLN